LRLFSFGGYGLALVALALVVFGAIDAPSFEKCLTIRLAHFNFVKGQIAARRMP